MPAYKPAMADEKVRDATGKAWNEWFKILDKAGAKKMPHKEIAAYLGDEHGVASWWCQTVTVEYERARGLRDVGMSGKGDYVVNAQRTVDLSLDELKEMWLDGRKRSRWLTPAPLRSAFTAGAKKARKSRSKLAEIVRVPLALGGEKEQLVEVMFSTNPSGRSVVNVAHSKIDNKAERERLKASWGEALDSLVSKTKR